MLDEYIKSRNAMQRVASTPNTTANTAVGGADLRKFNRQGSSNSLSGKDDVSRKFSSVIKTTQEIDNTSSQLQMTPEPTISMLTYQSSAKS